MLYLVFLMDGHFTEKFVFPVSESEFQLNFLLIRLFFIQYNSNFCGIFLFFLVNLRKMSSYQRLYDNTKKQFGKLLSFLPEPPLWPAPNNWWYVFIHVLIVISPWRLTQYLLREKHVSTKECLSYTDGITVFPVLCSQQEDSEKLPLYKYFTDIPDKCNLVCWQAGKSDVLECCQRRKSLCVPQMTPLNLLRI